MKIKTLTYCLGFLAAAFVITSFGADISKGKTSANPTFIKNGLAVTFIAENTNSNHISDKTKHHFFLSRTQILFHSFDFHIEPILTQYENQIRTNNRFATCLKI